MFNNDDGGKKIGYRSVNETGLALRNSPRFSLWLEMGDRTRVVVPQPNIFVRVVLGGRNLGLCSMQQESILLRDDIITRVQWLYITEITYASRVIRSLKQLTSYLASSRSLNYWTGCREYLSNFLGCRNTIFFHFPVFSVMTDIMFSWIKTVVNYR